MPHGKVTLIVEDPGSCPLWKPEDRLTFSGRAIQATPGSPCCAAAVGSLYQKLRPFLLSNDQTLLDRNRPLSCPEPKCGARFKIEFLDPSGAPARSEPSTTTQNAAAPTRAVPELSATRSQSRATRRMEQGAQAATIVLKQTGPFMSRISPETASELLAACKNTRYKPGEVILREGVHGDRLFLVADGEVDVVRSSPDDDGETVLVTLGMGECFGEMSLLTGQPTSASVRAKGEVMILSMIRSEFELFLATSPELNRVFSKLLADRLRAVNVTIEKELTRGILGKFSMISFLDLVQTFHASRRTGTLLVQGAGRTGRLTFLQGRLVDAALGELKGDEAFFEIARWREGDFCFENKTGESPAEERVSRDTMTLLMESARLLDEADRGASPPGPAQG